MDGSTNISTGSKFTWPVILGIGIAAAALLWIIWFFFLNENKATDDDKNSTKNLGNGQGTSNAPKGGVTGATVEQAFDGQYWKGLNTPTSTSPAKINFTSQDVTRSEQDALKLNTALGYDFGLFVTGLDVNAVKQVFTNANSKAFVSLITQSFKNKYSKDLYETVSDRLNDNQLQEIRIIVSKLADY